ncbi:MAG: aminodeoxychorismate lyase [Gammaproteobacteria bacterium]|nr:MAG: aminodeoxychorismate lyase [Gammaproteobacteria bacterium]
MGAGPEGAVRWLLDGREGACLGPLDRGLQYGDGLFETLAVGHGQPLLWGRHLARLEAGCDRLGLPRPDPETLAEEAAALCGGVARGVLKILLTRGEGGRGYRPPAGVRARPRRLLALHPWPPWPGRWWREGVRVRWCRLRLARQPALAGLKHLARLEQVLARAEWEDPEVAEGLLLDQAGRVVEATAANLLVLSGGRLLSPALEGCGVAGVMRGLILEEAAPAVGLPAALRPLAPAELEGAEGLALCSSLAGLWPVRELDGRPVPVPPLWARLQAWLVAQGALPPPPAPSPAGRPAAARGPRKGGP